MKIIIKFYIEIHFKISKKYYFKLIKLTYYSQFSQTFNKYL